MIIVRTPHRVSLCGGGTDLPAWYRQHGGAVVGFALAKYCYVSLRRLTPYAQGYRHRIVWSRIELVNSAADIFHPAVRAALAQAGIDEDSAEGVEIHHAGDVPAMAGLGSSSSFAVGLTHALAALRGKMKTERQLAEEAIHLEQNLMKEAVGSQDQIWAAYGGLNRIEFTPDGGFRVMSLVAPKFYTDIMPSLMLLYTGMRRVAYEIEAQKIALVDAREKELTKLAELTKSVEDAVINGDAPWLADNLDHAWQIKRELSPGVTTNDIDALYAKATAVGALGGKLLGAGGGGCILLVVPPDKRASIKKALGLIEIPLSVDRDGSRIMVYEPNGFS